MQTWPLCSLTAEQSSEEKAEAGTRCEYARPRVHGCVCVCVRTHPGKHAFSHPALRDPHPEMPWEASPPNGALVPPGVQLPTQHPPPLCPQASVAQQLCRQHIIAGQHMLEEAGTQAPRRWWTLAGQEITVSFSRFRVSRGLGLEARGVTGGEHSPGGGMEVDRALG